MTIKQIGIDIGKTSFHLIGLDADDAIVLRKQLTRTQLIRLFERHAGERLSVAFEPARVPIGWPISSWPWDMRCGS